MCPKEWPGDEVRVDGLHTQGLHPQAEVFQQLASQSVSSEGRGYHQAVHVRNVGIGEMEADPTNPELSLSVDLLAPEGYGEIIGGGQRTDSLELLEQRIAEHKLPKEAFEWYLDLRRYGSVPHSGFGLGVERTVTWICGVHHIRQTIPFPRTLGRMYP